jgi:hypothetical protein
MLRGACTVEVRQMRGRNSGWWISWNYLPIDVTDRLEFDSPLEAICLADRMLANGMRAFPSYAKLKIRID